MSSRRLQPTSLSNLTTCSKKKSISPANPTENAFYCPENLYTSKKDEPTTPLKLGDLPNYSLNNV